MTTEDRLTKAIWEAGALSNILIALLGDQKAEEDYVSRKIRENAISISDLFDAFCKEVNDEIAGLEEQVRVAA